MSDSKEFELYHGMHVAAPYRWLERLGAPATKRWAAAQARKYASYWRSNPYSRHVVQEVRALSDVERFSIPTRVNGGYLFYRSINGTEGPVLYLSKTLGNDRRILVDVNGERGCAIVSEAMSPDGRHLAYAVTREGADWLEWRVRCTKTRVDLSDTVRHSRVGNVVWSPDSQSFYYVASGRFVVDRVRSSVHAVVRHSIWEPQYRDHVLHYRPREPHWQFGLSGSTDGKYLIIYESVGVDVRSRVLVLDMRLNGAGLNVLFGRYDARYVVVGNEDETFFVFTNYRADRGRAVAVTRACKGPSRWIDVEKEPSAPRCLSSVTMLARRFVSVIRSGGSDHLIYTDRSRRARRKIDVPPFGSVGGVAEGRRDNELFFSFSSFVQAPIIFAYDTDSRRGKPLFSSRNQPLPPGLYVTKRTWFRSKDGTRVPGLICHRRNCSVASAPTAMHVYGGFGVTMTPWFAADIAAWLRHGGVYVLLAVRGGGERGTRWQEGGRRLKKQTAIDDCIAAAESLAARCTRPHRLGIWGWSGGGLLAAACVSQRPELFGAAVIQSALLDMVRYERLGGSSWTQEYGSIDDRAQFLALLNYSPLHHLAPRHYPATLVMASSRDKRVNPAHSLKFAAALQEVQLGARPLVLRYGRHSGHARYASKERVGEQAATIAFLCQALG